MMKRLAALLFLLPTAAAANCIPPWQVHFACDIPATNARAEFCRIADTAKHPGKKEAYYTYVVGDQPAELYFEASSVWFSVKDTNIDHPTDLTMAMGYPNGKWVYAFVVTEDKRLNGRIRDAEVRVYKSTDDFTSDQKDVEQLRLYCEPSSIIANQDMIAP
ncbi:hypothetical protein HOY34_00750 [Xinfangfangia sp. D13-10-4-6]|uniref:hypothetical protein n=1 Tax=Pseudogemmobacter hezensis TaxID=2737662 RepID=UPI001554A72F|nr:hypothetical protein [Pseudogemmobacter hezensis]NPD13727.1 hypothetical protein [Pseudogemmobacter hezensis]